MRQYASLIFYHDEEQRRLAQESLEQEEARRQARIYTEILPAGTFYPAEDYHQKYYLQGSRALFQEIQAIYPDINDVVASTAAARLNGYLGGYGSPAQLEKEIDKLGLSREGQERLLKITGLLPGPGKEGCPLPPPEVS